MPTTKSRQVMCQGLDCFRMMWLPVLLCVVYCSNDAVGFLSGRLPIEGEKSPVILRRKPGCYMDGKHYGFGERWSPVFVHQGLMVCIRCECLSVEKKGVFLAAGEIMCRNIKNLCPEPSCPEPILRPGKCCKACPADEDFENSFTFSPRARLSNEVFSLDAAQASTDNDFQALLVGRHVPSSPVRTRAVALVRMSISKGTVRFSVHYSRLDRPKYLRVLGPSGKVLYQTPVMKSLNGDRKACGVWRKMDQTQVDYLRREKLQVVITTSKYPDGAVGGRLKISKDVNEEIFSSLLVSSKSGGEGGVVSIAYDPRTKTAEYSITSEGVKRRKGKGLTFSISVTKGSKIIYRTRGTALPKTTKLLGKWRVYKRRHRKQLARGRLRMRVAFSDGQTLTGDIRPRQTCNVYQAVLSSGQTKSKARTQSTASAVVRLEDSGTLLYSIRLSGLDEDATRIQIEGHNSRSNSRSRAVGKLRYEFIPDSKNSPNGQAGGTFKRLQAEDVYRLLNNQLYISVWTGNNDVTALKGRLVAMEYHEHFQEKAVPVTLTPASEQARGGGASVWLSLDAGCVLHFDVLLTGKGKRSGPFGLLLGRYGNDSKELAVLRPPVGQRGEVIYQYRHVTGEVIDLSDDIFRDLDRGNTYLQINAKRRGQAVYRGNVTIPNNCWRYSNDMDSRGVDDDVRAVDHPFLYEEDSTPSCRFEGLFYSEGTAWIPDVDAACTTCSCVKGKTLCQKMTCPKLSCDDPVQLEGKCCPSCPDEDPREMCQLGRDPRKYPLNSVWHPFLPTQGFTTCAVCTCKRGRNAECVKLPCPVLECPKTEWIPSATNPCCYECGPKATTESPLEEPQGDVNMEGSCSFLGEIKANGDRWHPNVRPFGYLKCFACDCKDGQFACARLICPKLDCPIKIKHRNVCCEECAADQSIIPSTVDQTDLTKTQGQVCVFAGKSFEEGERWRPIAATPSENTQCAVCKCVAGSTKCRLRCPKVCADDMNGHACCKHCPAKAKDSKRQIKDKKRKKKNRKSEKKNKNKRSRKTRKRKSSNRGQGQGRNSKNSDISERGSRVKGQRPTIPSSRRQFLAMLSP